MENVAEKSVGQIVAEDYRVAQVFENHQIDFCCNGNRSLQEVAQDKNIEPETLLSEIKAIKNAQGGGSTDFDTWPLDLLADYIVKTHHRYAEKQIQTLKPYLEKISQVHGGRHPELFEIKEIFENIAGEITTHMKKEEIILFPTVKKIVQAKENQTELPNLSVGRVENPVSQMTHEHDDQGEAFKKIAELSNNFTPPADGCNTYKVTLGLLKDFQTDLHKHIHLENNILFPKVVNLAKELAV